MKKYLIKQNRKTTDFVLLEADDEFVVRIEGKVGKSSPAKFTGNAGSPAKAIEEIEHRVLELTEKGYMLTDLPDTPVETIVFDKAKWHLNEDFPEGLDHYQSYVHSGLFICWLIESNLYENEFKSENTNGINLLLSRVIIPSQFYADYMDGVFDSDGLKNEAVEFTVHYFNFENGTYLKDYLATLDPSDTCSSLFHIEDSWDNYDQLKLMLDLKFQEWRTNGK